MHVRLADPRVINVCKKLKLSGYTYFLGGSVGCALLKFVFMVYLIGTFERWDKDWTGMD